MNNQTKHNTNEDIPLLIELTAEDREEICFALRRCYCDYDDHQPDSWNRSIKKYNDYLDQLIEKVK